MPKVKYKNIPLTGEKYFELSIYPKKTQWNGENYLESIEALYFIQTGKRPHNLVDLDSIDLSEFVTFPNEFVAYGIAEKMGLTCPDEVVIYVLGTSIFNNWITKIAYNFKGKTRQVKNPKNGMAVNFGGFGNNVITTICSKD